MRSRRAALYSSSLIAPFLRSASRVVRDSWKSVRSCTLGGMVTLPELPGVVDPACGSAGGAAAGGVPAPSPPGLPGPKRGAARREENFSAPPPPLGGGGRGDGWVDLLSAFQP